jgi:hypothetical protein
MFQPYFLALLADAHGRAGQPEAGLRLLVEAFAAVDEQEERFYEAELHRLRGELLLQESGAAPGAGDAATEFEEAVAIARRQVARS